MSNFIYVGHDKIPLYSLDGSFWSSEPLSKDNPNCIYLVAAPAGPGSKPYLRDVYLYDFDPDKPDDPPMYRRLQMQSNSMWLGWCYQEDLGLSLDKIKDDSTMKGLTI